MEQSRDQIQLSFGRLVDWQSANPLLLPGEVAVVFDNDTIEPIDLRVGNGITRFNDLPSLVNNDIVYTKDEVDEFLQQLKDTLTTDGSDIGQLKTELYELKTVTIQGILDEIDTSANISNKLTSLSTVIDSIYNLVDERFGRELTYGEEVVKFPSLDVLSRGPWYCHKKEVLGLKAGDIAEVTGAEFKYKYDGAAWNLDTTKFVLTEAQEKAINSGITAEKVNLIDVLKTTTTRLETKLTTLEDQTNAVYTDVNSLKSSVAKIYKGYKNTATITANGTGYSKFATCRLRTIRDSQFVADGFILSVSTSGGVARDGLFILDTPTQIEADIPLEIVSDVGSGATCTVTSVEHTYGLSTDYDLRYSVSGSHSYLQELIRKYVDTRLPRGNQDGNLQMVRNGNLVPVFVSDAVRYVDGSYTGTEEGLEFAPYRTGTAGLNSFEDDSEGTLVFAAGTYAENITVAKKKNKNILGQAVGSRSNTTINSLSIDTACANIGVRDIYLTNQFRIGVTSNVEGGTETSKIYADNITVGGETIISVSDFAFFTHCTFTGNVTVKKGTVSFDCCTFSDTSILTVQGADTTVCTEGCMNLSPWVRQGATYLQFSGCCTPKQGNSSDKALTANTAKFVGLFNGAALKADNSYAPIAITSSKFALGSFLFDVANSALPGSSFRQLQDGIHSSQIYVGARTDGESGYISESPYLTEHLAAISARLKQLETLVSDSEFTGLISDVNLEAGEEPATLKFTKTTLGVPEPEEKTITVTGLGTAAYTSSDAYATAVQGKLADSAYQKPEGGIPKTDLAADTFDEVKGQIEDLSSSLDESNEAHEKLSNKIKYGDGSIKFNEESTDDQYPSSKLVYEELKKPLAEIQNILPSTESSDENRLVNMQDLYEFMNTGYFRRIVPYGNSAEGVEPERRTVFASIDVLNTESTELYLLGGTKVLRSAGELHDHDMATFFKWKATIEGQTKEITRADYGTPDTKVSSSTAHDGDYYVDASVTPYKVYKYVSSSTGWQAQDAIVNVLRQQAIAIYDGGVTGNWKYIYDVSVDLTREQQAAIDSGITKQLVDKFGNIIGLSKTVAEEIEARQMKIPAEKDGQIVTHSGNLGIFGTPRSVTETIEKSSTTVKDKKYGKLNYGEDTKAIPTSKAVSDLVADVTTKVESELAARDTTIQQNYTTLDNAKENKFVRDYSENKKFWPHFLTDGTSEVLTDIEMQKKLNDVLSASTDNEKYLSKKEAKTIYTAGETSPKAPDSTNNPTYILGNPRVKGGVDTDSKDLVQQYYVPVSTLTYTDGDGNNNTSDDNSKTADRLIEKTATYIPTAQAVVKDTIARVEHLHEHIEAKVTAKQNKLNTSTTPQLLVRPTVAQSEDGNEDNTESRNIITSMDAVKDSANDGIPTAGAVYAKEKETVDKLTTLDKFVKGKVLSDSEGNELGEGTTVYSSLKKEIEDRADADDKLLKQIYGRLLPTDIFKDADRTTEYDGKITDADTDTDGDNIKDKDEQAYVDGCIPYFKYDETTGKIRIENSTISKDSLIGALAYTASSETLSIQSFRTYYPTIRSSGETDSWLTPTALVDNLTAGTRIQNFNFIPVFNDEGIVDSAISLISDKTTDATTYAGLGDKDNFVEFVDSTIALDLSHSTTNYIRFIDSDVYLIASEGQSFGGAFEFKNCRVFLQLKLAAANPRCPIRCKFTDSTVFVFPCSQLFVDKASKGTDIYICDARSKDGDKWTITDSTSKAAFELVSADTYTLSSDKQIVSIVDDYKEDSSSLSTTFCSGLTVIYESSVIPSFFASEDKRIYAFLKLTKYRCRVFIDRMYSNDTVFSVMSAASPIAGDPLGNPTTPLYVVSDGTDLSGKPKVKFVACEGYVSRGGKINTTSAAGNTSISSSHGTPSFTGDVYFGEHVEAEKGITITNGGTSTSTSSVFISKPATDITFAASKVTCIGCTFDTLTLPTSGFDTAEFIHCTITTLNLGSTTKKCKFIDCIIGSISGTGNACDIIGGTVTIGSEVTIRSISRADATVSAKLNVSYMTDCILSVSSLGTQISPKFKFAGNHVSVNSDTGHTWRPIASGGSWAAIYGNFNGEVIF